MSTFQATLLKNRVFWPKKGGFLAILGGVGGVGGVKKGVFSFREVKNGLF